MSLQIRTDDGTLRLVSTDLLDIGFASDAFADVTWQTFSVAYDADLAAATIRINNAASGSLDVTGPTGYLYPRAVGVKYSGALNRSEFFKGDILFLANFSGVHNTTQRQAVEAWITSTFGI